MQTVHYVEIESFPRPTIIEAENGKECKTRLLDTRIIVIHIHPPDRRFVFMTANT
jgi:hypothetical protein